MITDGAWEERTCEHVRKRRNTRHDFNDEAIPTGMRYWCGVVREELGSRRDND